jgi:hypothetical protein
MAAKSQSPTAGGVFRVRTVTWFQCGPADAAFKDPTAGWWKCNQVGAASKVRTDV